MRVWIDLKYVTRKASGLYYYRRRIPNDLRSHYKNTEFYHRSLQTKELAEAGARSLEKTTTTTSSSPYRYYSNLSNLL